MIHLHCHTHYSLLDGANRIDKLVARAKALGQPALAITDHGNMFGVPEFYRECRKQDIKPVIGIEAYIAPGSRFDKAKTYEENSYHLILLAENNTGYQNLMRLSTCAFLEGFYYKPRIDKELLLRHGDGLIISSACLAGEVATLMQRDRSAAVKAIEWYAENFPGRYYLEVQNHGIPEEAVYKEIYQLAKEMGIPTLASNDVHYLEKGDHDAHDVLVCIQTGKNIHDHDRLKYNTEELYLKNDAEMLETFRGMEDAIENTRAVAERCNVEIEFGRSLLPRFNPPGEFSGKPPIEYLTHLVNLGLERRYPKSEIRNPKSEISSRVNHELKTIEQMGFAAYFLIVHDFVNYARSQNIPVGLGRGSAAGSIVAYALGITGIDPLKYDLLFERFLNPHRYTMPDIDIDFCFERREEVIDYVKHKYGEDRVMRLITFGTMQSRAALKDVGRAMGMDFQATNKLSQMIPIVQAQPMAVREAFETVPELKQYTTGEWANVLRYADKLEGLNRSAGVHAAGVIIAPEEITRYMPLFANQEGSGAEKKRVITTQYDMGICEELGLLKMDFLGLRTLTVIDACLQSCNLESCNLDSCDDEPTFRLFASARTIGIFQFESQGMREALARLKPTCIQDLIALNALYRPGPMDFLDEFIDRKHGRRQVSYLHPLLEPILQETYGIIIYQEQVMRVASDCAGFSLGEADILRRAIGKKKPEVMEKYKQQFIEGCKNHGGIVESIARQLWGMIEKFAEYGFNKSHSAAYSVLAYQAAYLKTHYPAEFMAASLSSETGNPKRIAILMGECARLKLSVTPPDINVSNYAFTISPLKKGAGGLSTPLKKGAGGLSQIVFGLGAVKNIGKASIEKIISARAGKPFADFQDFANRLQEGKSNISQKAIESLILCGAFDNLHGFESRAALLKAVPGALKFAAKLAASQIDHSPTLFDQLPASSIEHRVSFALPQTRPFSKSQSLAKERELLGFYLSGNPLTEHREVIDSWSTIDWDMEEMHKGAPVKAVGILTDIKKHIDKKNRTMAFVMAEDLGGELDLVIFADLYEQHHEQLKKGSILAFRGSTDTFEEGRLKMVVDEIVPLKDLSARAGQKLHLVIDTAQTGEPVIDSIFNIVNKNRGMSPLSIRVVNTQTQTNVDLQSKIRVEITEGLINSLKRFLPEQNIQIQECKNG